MLEMKKKIPSEIESHTQLWTLWGQGPGAGHLGNVRSGMNLFSTLGEFRSRAVTGPEKVFNNVCYIQSLSEKFV